MTANNSKVLSEQMLRRLNATYRITYDKDRDVAIVGLTTCARKTEHDASQPFHINAKKFKRKVCFSPTMIEIWKELIAEKKTANVTLFDVHTAVTTLRVMYQPITKAKVVEMLKQNFNGIKRV